MGSRLSNRDLFILGNVRRTMRQYELFCWQTAPEFLRTR
jgi:hypothetical protein